MWYILLLLRLLLLLLLLSLLSRLVSHVGLHLLLGDPTLDWLPVRGSSSVLLLLLSGEGLGCLHRLDLLEPELLERAKEGLVRRDEQLDRVGRQPGRVRRIPVQVDHRRRRRQVRRKANGLEDLLMLAGVNA